MNRHFVVDRRRFLAASAAMLLAGPAFAARDVIEVFKSPNCGCCTKWIGHLRANGFEEIGRASCRERVSPRV